MKLLVKNIPTPCCRSCRQPVSAHAPGCLDAGRDKLEMGGCPDVATGQHCPRCAGKYHVCSCPRVGVDKVAGHDAEPEGAEREGWERDPEMAGLTYYGNRKRAVQAYPRNGRCDWIADEKDGTCCGEHSQLEAQKAVERAVRECQKYGCNIVDSRCVRCEGAVAERQPVCGICHQGRGMHECPGGEYNLLWPYVSVWYQARGMVDASVFPENADNPAPRRQEGERENDKRAE